MPHKPNESIGRCPCPSSFCDEIADVRTQKNHPGARRYLYCPACRVVRLTGAAFQAYISQHMQPIGATAQPEPQPEKPAKAAPVVATARPEPQPEKKKRGGLFAALDDALGDF